MLRDFSKIETFLTVVKEKSFSKASKKLGISQPAVTQQIKLLEDYLETKIVDRKKNGIKLTKSGEELYKITQKLEKCIASAEKELIKIINKELIFIIGGSYMIGNYILPDFISEIQTAIKNDVMIKVDSSERITEELLEKRIDLALIESPTFHDGLIYRDWMEDELVIVSKSVLPKYIKKEDLYTFNWICREEESNTRKIIYETFEKIGVDCKSFELRSIVTSSTAVKNSILRAPSEPNSVPTVSILSKHMVSEEVEKGELYISRLKGFKLSRKLYLVHTKERKQDAFIDSVINYIMSKRRL
ncbi:MAG TPA: LysR family transcriptional regulator [Sulfurospirillum sp. UBA12182]|nr:MAG TPA: LysR family transcriptional regulator [Sulfurospirillum sp. UBA12182]